jgi:hypothetical protein
MSDFSHHIDKSRKRPISVLDALLKDETLNYKINFNSVNDADDVFEYLQNSLRLSLAPVAVSIRLKNGCPAIGDLVVQRDLTKSPDRHAGNATAGGA